MICTVELDLILVHQADGWVRTGGRGGELLQGILPDLMRTHLSDDPFQLPRAFWVSFSQPV